jgi:HK97 family phage major capsid protein
MKSKNLSITIACLALTAIVAVGFQSAGVNVLDVAKHVLMQPEIVGLSLLAGMGNIELIQKSLDQIESKMAKYDEKASNEIAAIGKISTETKNAIDTLGTEQRTLADRLLAIEQKSSAPGEEKQKDESVGAQFVKSADYQAFQKAGGRGKVAMEVKNTVTNAIGNTFSDRKPSVVGGAFRALTLEQLLTTLPTSSNAVDYVREATFTNAAAEATEGAVKAESAVTTTLVTEPVATIAHWLKISKQLAQDNPALAAYINFRLIYGCNLRVENQIINGNGTAPNISGFTKSGNFTAHGYTTASLTALGLSATNRFDLIGKIIGDCALADFPADVIVLNPGDFWTMRLAKDTTGRYILGDPGMDIAASLFGLPVVASNAVTADNVMVANLAQAATFYKRDEVVVELSDSDTDNFQRNLITVRAERRAMLAVERPAAVRYGDLTPA